jgi:Holliday junction DNA helicase RuvA
MIDSISGRLVEKKPMQAIVENNGIGFTLNTSLQTYSTLPNKGAQAYLKSYLHVREDSMQLFGFATEEERQVFLALVSVSGVGPRLAQTILSGMQAGDLVHAIKSGDTEKLTGVRGVGKKTAQRLVVELNEKFTQLGIFPEQQIDEIKAVALDALHEEALMALLSLGYRKQEAESAIRRVRHPEKNVTVEELIKNALQTI